MLTAEQKNARMSEDRAFLTKLLESALKGDWATLETSVLQYAKDHGVTPLDVLTEFKDGQKRTALHFACQSTPNNDTNTNDTSQKDIVECILRDDWIGTPSARQKILKQKDKDGFTPIMLAAQNANPKLAEKRVLYLLQLSSKDNLKLGLARSKTGATSLHYAAGASATRKTIQALYEVGKVALSTFSNQGGTPLHWAAAAAQIKQKECDNDSDIETIDALLECGANVNACNETIPPPLVLAVASSNDRRAKRFLQCPTIDIEETTKALPGGLTLYHMAADLNLVGTLSLLLEKAHATKDASSVEQILSQKNHDGLTPLDLAAQEGHVGCVLLLLAVKSDPAPTEEDAKAYIEEYQKTKGTKETTVPKEATTSKEESTVAPSTNNAKKGEDPIEEQAQQKAAQLATSPDPSQDMIDKALEWKRQGNAHFTKKEWKEAHDQYSQAISCNPKEATFYSNRSVCCVNMNRLTEALEDAVMSRMLRPNWSKACYRLAVARFELGRYEDAALAAWEGLQQDQENDELKRLLQKCVKKGRTEHQQTLAKQKKEDTR